MHLGRLTVRAGNLHLVRDAELLKLLHARLHGGHIAFGTHDDADDGILVIARHFATLSTRDLLSKAV